METQTNPVQNSTATILPFRIRTIFHPTDFSKGDEKAFLHALRIALAVRGEISLLHVDHTPNLVDWSEFPRVSPILEKWGRSHDTIDGAFSKKSQLKIQKVRKSGREPREILKFLERHPAHLVVLATHQRGPFARMIHKAVAEPIARKSGQMTLFVPRKCKGFISEKTGDISIKRVLIPIDKHPHPQLAVNLMLDLLRTFEIPQINITFLHVNGDESDCPSVNVASSANVKCEYAFARGNVVNAVLKTADKLQCDLLVMATQGHKGFLDALRGSTTEQVLRKTPCPLLAIPSDSGN